MKKKNKPMFESPTSSFIFGFMIGCVAFVIGMFLSQNFNLSLTGFSTVNKYIEHIEVQDIIEDCNNLTLFKSAFCIKKHIKKIYKYKETDDDIDLTFEQLKEQGGDCKNWAELYCDIGDELNFNSKYVSFLIGLRNITEGNLTRRERSFAHAICIWSNSDGYVVLDGNSFSYNDFDYGKFKNDEVEVEIAEGQRMTLKI